MSELFLTILNMSITASYVILFVVIIRIFLKRTPKSIFYLLWCVVAFRLVSPFSFVSILSFLPKKASSTINPHDVIYQSSQQSIDSFMNKPLPLQTFSGSFNTMQTYIEIGSYLWIIGTISLIIYSFLSILLIRKQLEGSELIEQNIFESKNLKTPFVLGLIRPKIYLPVGLSTDERKFILIHENTHIHRKDHITKFIAFLILTIHWFNPIVWIAFILMSTDMEYSCDERVLKKMDESSKKPYATSLLNLATERHILNGCPLAFSEGNVKGRIKNVLNYKEPNFWIILSSIFIITTVSLGLLMNPKPNLIIENESVLIGEYRSEDGLAWLEIEDNNEFLLIRHVAAGYAPRGDYIIVGDYLILQVDGNEDITIVFRIEEDRIIFESGDGLIQKGKVFTYEK